MSKPQKNIDEEGVAELAVMVVYSRKALDKAYWGGGLVPWSLYTRKDSLCIVTGTSRTLLGSVTRKEKRRTIDGSRPPFHSRITGGIKDSPLWSKCDLDGKPWDTPQRAWHGPAPSTPRTCW